MSAPLRCTKDMVTDIELSCNTDLELKPMTTCTLRLRKTDNGMNSTISLRESTELRPMMMSHLMTLKLLMLLRT
jgi:hypothetical protein